jgi:putative transposase
LGYDTVIANLTVPDGRDTIILTNMSRKANPWDNAQAESFMASVKKEEVYLSNYDTLEEARARLPYFIDAVYNRRRPHSALGYLSPVAFEIQPKLMC